MSWPASNMCESRSELIAPWFWSGAHTHTQLYWLQVHLERSIWFRQVTRAWSNAGRAAGALKKSVPPRSRSLSLFTSLRTVNKKLHSSLRCALSRDAGTQPRQCALFNERYSIARQRARLWSQSLIVRLLWRRIESWQAQLEERGGGSGEWRPGGEATGLGRERALEVRHYERSNERAS